VPVVLSAVTFDNYGGTCGYEYPAWVQDLAKTEGRIRPSARALQRYREMQDFQNSKDRPYIHLVDGGVADNIGMRSVLEAWAAGASATFRGDVASASSAGSWSSWRTPARLPRPVGPQGGPTRHDRPIAQGQQVPSTATRSKPSNS
jgi:hypothetical protein